MKQVQTAWFKNRIAHGFYDLHFHSTASDGSDPPAVLAQRIAKAGLKTVALTDHDAFDGIVPLRRVLPDSVDVIVGVELSTDVAGQEVHLLGYFPTDEVWYAAAWQDFLQAQRRHRQQRNRLLCKRLQDIGLPVFYEAVAAQYGEDRLARPHIAKWMVDHQLVSDIQTAFKQYLAEGASAYVARIRPDIETAIGWIKQCNGISILAHPYLYGWIKPHEASGQSDTMGPISAGVLETYLRQFQKKGLDGVEVVHGQTPIWASRQIQQVAKTLSMIETAGSDDHGVHKPGVHLFSAQDWIDQTRGLALLSASHREEGR